MTGAPGDPTATDRFADLVRRILAELDDPEPGVLGDALAALDSFDPSGLGTGDALDLDILRARLAAMIWQDDAPPAPLGERSYAAALWCLLDTRTDPGQLLVRAESELMASAERLADLARGLRLGDRVVALEPRAVVAAHRRLQADPAVDRTLARPVPFDAVRARGTTAVRSRFPSPAMLAGWDAWTRTHLLPPRGATAPTARQEFVAVVRRARVLVRAVVDVRVNVHGAGVDEVRETVVHQGFEPAGTATALHAQALGAPTGLAAGLVGLEELRAVVDGLRERDPGIGPDEIADRVLAFGPVAPTRLAGLLSAD